MLDIEGEWKINEIEDISVESIQKWNTKSEKTWKNINRALVSSKNVLSGQICM